MPPISLEPFTGQLQIWNNQVNYWEASTGQSGWHGEYRWMGDAIQIWFDPKGGDDLHSTILEEIHYATVYEGVDDLGRRIVMRLLFQLYLDELSNSWAIEWAS